MRRKIQMQMKKRNEGKLDEKQKNIKMLIEWTNERSGVGGDGGGNNGCAFNKYIIYKVKSLTKIAFF